MRNDKPEGAKIGWEILSSTEPFSTPWLRLSQDQVHLAGRGEITYTYCQMGACVCVVPMTSDGQIIMIRQYRYAIDAWCLEVPGGGLNDNETAGSIVELAHKELREEIGATCTELLPVTEYYSANGVTNEVSHIFLALGVTLTDDADHEPAEFIELVPLPAHEAIALARSGAIKDGYSALALLLSEPLLRERGLLPN